MSNKYIYFILELIPLILIYAGLFFWTRRFETIFLVYSIGLFADRSLNIFIKWILKPFLKNYKFLERPMDQNLVGMPSGHASSMGYTLAFWLNYTNKFDTGVFIIFIFGLLVSYSRYVMYRHTIFQIILGYCLGLIIGFVASFAGLSLDR